MGNAHSSPDIEWKMVGRCEDMRQIKNILKNVRHVNITGMKKIGKSRVIFALAESFRAEYDFSFIGDFEDVDVNDFSDVSEHIQDACSRIGKEETNPEVFRPEENSDTSNDVLRSQVNVFYKRFRKRTLGKQSVILFLDNLDKVLESNLKDVLLDFVTKIQRNCSNTKIVLGHSIRTLFTLNGFQTYEIRQLSKDAVMELLFETTENRNKSRSCCSDMHFSNDMNVFKEGNKPYLEAIALLCEGLPLAATMSGMMLTEDNGLLEPEDLVEILITARLKNLSPGNCPPDERLDLYENPMHMLKKKLKRHFKDFYDLLNDNMKGCEFELKDAMDAAKDIPENTKATVKQTIQAGINIGIISTEEKNKLYWHGILREGLAVLEAVEHLPTAKDSEKITFKFMAENAKRAGLQIDENILRSRKALAQEIKRLGGKIFTKADLSDSTDLCSVFSGIQETQMPPLRFGCANSCITQEMNGEPNMEELKCHDYELRQFDSMDNTIRTEGESEMVWKKAVRYSADSSEINLQFKAIHFDGTNTRIDAID